MTGDYELVLNDQMVGNVNVTRQGLYYQFSCQCKLDRVRIYRIAVRCGDKQESLGIPVPGEHEFALERKIPVSHFGRETPQFYVVSADDKVQGRFVAVDPEKPFPYLQELKNAVMAEQNGVKGIRIS